jgi:hypothetical protein
MTIANTATLASPVTRESAVPSATTTLLRRRLLSLCPRAARLRLGSWRVRDRRVRCRQRELGDARHLLCREPERLELHHHVVDRRAELGRVVDPHADLRRLADELTEPGLEHTQSLVRLVAGGPHPVHRPHLRLERPARDAVLRALEPSPDRGGVEAADGVVQRVAALRDLPALEDSLVQ